MEFGLRFLQFIFKLIYSLVYKLLMMFKSKDIENPLPPITNIILTKSLIEVIEMLKSRQLTSKELVLAYIKRVKEVNPYLNAVIEPLYYKALQRSKEIDALIQQCKEKDLNKLWEQYPLLGVPCTVKESCGLKGMSFVVGCTRREGMRCIVNGDTVENILNAGAIPLLVSATPEYCFNIETNTITNGRTCNPYDCRRTSGGSSGGEGALNGCGASLFGIGSDIAGSIRIPCLFNGIFGHKPSSELMSVKGHFPFSSDDQFAAYLQTGPMTRFATDLELLTTIMAGKNAKKMRKAVDLDQIKIFYSLGFDGINGLLHPGVDSDITNSILRAVDYFKSRSIHTKPLNLSMFKNSMEISLSAIASLEDFPYLIEGSNHKGFIKPLWEYVKSLMGFSAFTKDGLLFDLMRRTNGFMAQHALLRYKLAKHCVEKSLTDVLGSTGVLFFPTFHVPAIHHNTSHLAVWGIDYTLLFNILGFPATHVTMGVNEKNIPFGFQVIAAPYYDKLCFTIAKELEIAFGGWTPPVKHNICLAN